MEPLFESSAFKISFVDQWHDKRLSNVLFLALEITEECKIDAKRVFMMCSRFIAQISTFFTKPQNIHRITILLLSTLFAMTESSFDNCVRSSEHIFPLAFLVTVIVETYAMLLFYRLWEWMLIRRSRNPRSLHFYESIPLRPETILANIRESSVYEPNQHNAHQIGLRRPLSVMLPPDLPSIPLPRIPDARARQDAILQGQLDDICKKLVIADRICVAVISVSFVVLEAVFC
uniref:Bestrophin homolog n=1 Tax=Ascaris lumbricoides TaxID=6252 RepID=A0A0M3HU71_ASCLU